MATAASRRRVSGLPHSRTMQAGQTIAVLGRALRNASISLRVAGKGLWHSPQIGRSPCCLSIMNIRQPALAHGVSRKKRAKPPCLITLKACAFAAPSRSAAVRTTSPTGPDIDPPRPGAQPGAGLRRLRSPAGSVRFMRHPAGVLRRFPRTPAHHRRGSPSCWPASASAGL